MFMDHSTEHVEKPMDASEVSQSSLCWQSCVLIAAKLCTCILAVAVVLLGGWAFVAEVGVEERLQMPSGTVYFCEYHIPFWHPNAEAWVYADATPTAAHDDDDGLWPHLLKDTFSSSADHHHHRRHRRFPRPDESLSRPRSVAPDTPLGCHPLGTAPELYRLTGYLLVPIGMFSMFRALFATQIVLCDDFTAASWLLPVATVPLVASTALVGTMCAMRALLDLPLNASPLLALALVDCLSWGAAMVVNSFHQREAERLLAVEETLLAAEDTSIVKIDEAIKE